MKPMPPNDSDKYRQTQNRIRLFVVLLVAFVLFVSVIMMNKEKEDREMKFDFVDAGVEWDNDTKLMVGLNDSYIYNVNIIGSNEDGSHTVTQMYNSTLNTSYILVDIEKMLDMELDIVIEIENLSLDVKESQALLVM